MTNSNANTQQGIEPLPAVEFDDLSEAMKAAAIRMGWTDLMPVQARSFPYFREERDVMVQSRTGSGKTGAFLLPMIERVNPKIAACQAMVLVPTRELANQVHEEAAKLTAGSKINAVAVYGGVSYEPQNEAFKKGAHIVVGTPGRILDHLMRRSLTLDRLDMLVFDEADRMMSMGFYPDMKRIRGFLPKHEVNAYMFSATYPSGVISLARQFMYEPEFLSLSHDSVHVAEVEHAFYNVPAMEKDRCLIRILEVENPESAIIFCNRKARVDYVTTVLQRFGYNADRITSDLTQSQREKVLERVHARKVKYLVATDVAARGIDISNLSHVIQYEPPDDHESYVHRAGRTGRAGAGGVAITLTSGIEEAALGQIRKLFKINFEERTVPTEEEVEAIVSQRTAALLEARFRQRNTLEIERLQRFRSLARELVESADSEQLLAMLLDDVYHTEFHGGAEPIDPAQAAETKAHIEASKKHRKKS
ncbi:MAG: ATP-dependent helicase DeaD [Candidatus Sumerlaeota bacterium]|nr:ATP-dependent helicase DeaD [Candidatus Sumerlaeota bacterium]